MLVPFPILLLKGLNVTFGRHGPNLHTNCMLPHRVNIFWRDYFFSVGYDFRMDLAEFQNEVINMYQPARRCLLVLAVVAWPSLSLDISAVLLWNHPHPFTRSQKFASQGDFNPQAYTKFQISVQSHLSNYWGCSPTRSTEPEAKIGAAFVSWSLCRMGAVWSSRVAFCGLLRFQGKISTKHYQL